MARRHNWSRFKRASPFTMPDNLAIHAFVTLMRRHRYYGPLSLTTQTSSGQSPGFLVTARDDHELAVLRRQFPPSIRGFPVYSKVDRPQRPLHPEYLL